MNYLGDFAHGKTVYVWWNTFDSNDPSASVTMTNFINTDVHIHRDDNLTQRNNAAGVAVDVDVDAIAGSHFISIDTSDDTVADFYQAGHDYAVRIEGVTIDGATVNAVVGTFSIENRRVAGELAASQIATLASQTSFTLTTGEASGDDDAYNGCIIVVTDETTMVQKCIGLISDYVGSTRTVTLAEDPGIFTMAIGDKVSIIATSALANIRTVDGTLQTANDNGADINTLLTRIVGTLASGTHNAQSGDAYGIVNDGTFGNSALDTDLGTLLTRLSAVRAGYLDELAAANIPADIDTLLTRIVGTLAAGTHTAQSGDSYPTVNTNLDATVSSRSSHTAADAADAVHDEAMSGHLTGGTHGEYMALMQYAGPRGPGVYLDDAAANTNTTLGVDGTYDNPVSTIAAAITIAATVGKRIYLINDTDITLGATMDTYELVGIGAVDQNSIALASQDVDGSAFYNLHITGVQGGTERAYFEGCTFGVCTLYLFARWCGLTDSTSTGITFSDNDDNILEHCFSMVAGNAAPVLTCSAANLDLSVRHFSGGLQIENSHSTATLSIETNGQVIFDATCNVNTAVSMRGCMTITDNTGGMVALTDGAVYNESQINAQVLDVLTVDTLTLPGQEAPPLTPTFEEALTWLYKVLRNRKSQTSTVWSLFADDETTVDAKATVSDDTTTAVKQEIVSGP